MLLAKIKRETPILEVARRIGLTVRGRVGRCFSHYPDCHPSLYFNPIKNRFKCFVCPGVGGSVIDLVMQVLGLSLPKAIEYLESEFRSGAIRPQCSVQKSYDKEGRKASFIELEEKCRIFAAFLSRSPLEKEGAAYLSGRGIDVNFARSMGIGFLRAEEYQWLDRALARRFGQEPLKASGLGRFYLLAKEGLSFVLFPYRFEGGIHMIKARSLLGKEEAHSRGVVRFIATGRSDLLYNHDLLERADLVYICEGEIDTVTLLQIAYPAVGISGVNGLHPKWFSLFSEKEVVLCLDSDFAGKKASERLAGEFQRRGIRHRRLELPDGFDVNRYLTEAGID